MKKMVYKFLDEYLGKEVGCIELTPTKTYKTYCIFSKRNKSKIMYFRVYSENGNIIIFRNIQLIATVSNFFSINSEDTTSILRDWFGDTHNLGKVSDLMKFV